MRPLSSLELTPAFQIRMADELRIPVLRRLLFLVMGLAWIAVAPITVPGAGFVLCLVTMVFALLSLWALQHSYRWGAWLFLTGLTSCGIVAAALYPQLPFPYLLSFVVGAGVFLIGSSAGLFVAALLTGALFYLSDRAGVEFPPSTLPGSILLLWLLALLTWTGTQPMHTLSGWLWRHYEEMRQRMDELQTYQAQLTQTLRMLDQAREDLARANRKLRISNAVAAEARQAKAEFAANISHELRTPINMITGFTEMILNAPRAYAQQGLPPALLADMNVVLRNAQHLSDLINDILDLSQLDVGRMALVREWADLREIAESAVGAIAPLAEARGLTLRTELEEGLPPALIDKVRIRQVLLNLLSNAVRFTEEGEIALSARRCDGYIVVSVRDTGPGIAAQDLPKLFEPFRQLDGSLGRRYGGSGLGLAISRSFVALHGGDMKVESTVGQGTQICLRLPLENNVPPSQLYQAADPELPRIKAAAAEYVVVEPRPVVERLLRRYLAEDAVIAAPTIPAALQISRNQVTRAIVVRATHEQEAHRLRTEARQANYDAPLIVCAMPGLPEVYAEELGLAGYLLKPITRQRLLAALAALPDVQTLLVVDDDLDFRHLIMRMVRTAARPYTVWQAASAAEALALLAHRRPDAILLDVLLPDMDGPSLLERIRAREALHEVPVLFVTAQDASGSPLVANFLDITHRGGLSADELLRCIRAIGEAFRGATPPADRALSGQPDREPPAVVPA
jgi:signal transduction histidine kinase/CheY-like chemotaxis protein